LPLDPQAKRVLDEMGALSPPVESQTPFEAREGMRKMQVELFEKGLSQGAISKVADKQIEGNYGKIAVRIYYPSVEDQNLPTVLYFHGGGWVTGSIEIYDSLCRHISARSGCIVISVGYHLAPEYKFPIGAEDCYTATKWAKEHSSEIRVDATRLAVCGDSAGGNLAAAVALISRDRGGPALRLQILLCPATDFRFDTGSNRDCGVGYGLTTEEEVWSWNHYLKTKEDANSPYASPMRAPDLRHLPRAFIVTAEFDPLRDDGEAYGRRLSESGVRTRVERYPGMIHGFYLTPGLIDLGNKAIDDIANELKSMFEL
jgi:acetyl esterase